jgi:hypothetical protein
LKENGNTGKREERGEEKGKGPKDAFRTVRRDEESTKKMKNNTNNKKPLEREKGAVSDPSDSERTIPT